MLSYIFLVLFPVVYGIIHNAAYNEYPNCAITCLSTNGTEYPNNFANNCDYESGECCTGAYREIIAATWECVWSHCQKERSLEAFGTFVDFCEDMGHPLRKDDIPTGYEPVDPDDKDEDKDDDGDEKIVGPLTKNQIIGIAVGAGATAIITTIVIMVKCCFREAWISWRNRH